MDESITLESGSFKTDFKLYWSNNYASLMIHHEENGEIREQFLMDASSVVLREIGNQLLDWAYTLEQVEHDEMDKLMAERVGLKNG